MDKQIDDLMIHGIAVVGANGSGKTTLGGYLADLLGYQHMDIEDYYFKKSVIPYADPRTREEVKELLLADMKKYDRFVLSAVNGDFGNEINALYGCVVYIKAPLEIRLERVKQRAVDKFGSRVLKGGDMYEQEQDFFEFVSVRTMDKTDEWLQRMECPVIYVDGTEPIAHNAIKIERFIAGLCFYSREQC